MLPTNQKFYRPYDPYVGTPRPVPQFVPYESDTESEASDSEGSTVTRTTDSPENLPDTVAFANALQLNETGGQDLPTAEAQLQYGVNQLAKNKNYASLRQAFNIDLPFNSKDFDTSGSKIWDAPKQSTQPTTSIIMLNSRDRDRSVYPTPANVTLRLPRIYNNITSMQVIQLKLLSSFLYFRLDKNNTCMTINEFGRIAYNYLNEAGGQLNVKKCIREGSYNINTLIAELTIQLNTPPLFFDYPGGFSQFVPLFVATGDFGYAFNYPGEFFYDSLNRVYTAAPSRNYIITRFWATPTLGFTPNLTQTKVAYYYPVLRECVLDPDFGIGKLNTNINTSALLPGETIYSRIVYAFQGVNDVIIQEMIDANITELDIYRSQHTFRNSLVNRYVVSYETYNNRMYIQSPSLNTSLVNLLNTQYQIFLAQQLTNFGLSSSQYAALQSINSALLSVVNAMYDYIQTQLAIYFGINFNTFAPIYFTSPNNYMNVQNALNAIGVSSNYDLQVLSSGTQPFTKNIIEVNRQQPEKSAAGTTLWPNMSNLTTGPLGMQGYPTNLGAANVAPFFGGCNYPYSITLNDVDLTRPFIDAEGDVYVDQRRKAGDIITPIQASRYTVFRFRSLYRQTLQVETMPRPTQYRYPAYNAANYGSNINAVFDNSYSYVYNATNVPAMDNVNFGSLSNIYGFEPGATNFGDSYPASKASWGSNSVFLNVTNNLVPFVFYLPLPPTPPPAPAYRHRVALTVVNFPDTSTIPAGLKLFLYHDRAAFMADLSGNARNESDLRYKVEKDISSTDISSTVIFTAYAGQPYYCILRSAQVSFTSTRVQLVAWYPDGSNYEVLSDSLVGFNPFGDPTTPAALSNFNYAQVEDPAFIKLPISSNLWGINPTGNEVNTNLAISNVPIGYDQNNVSTDLTDYVGFVANSSSNNLNPTALIRNDPISGYFFQVGNGYNISAQSYFYSGSSNFLLAPSNQSNYTPGTVDYRQYKIVQWYDTTYIPDPVGFPNPLSNVDVSPNIPPYTVASTAGVPISNYNYDTLSPSNIQLGQGCCGFSFIPSDGQWSIDRVMFRSAFTTVDRNSNIAYLGVFLTNTVNTTPTFRLALSNAVAKLNFSKKRSYPTSASVNFGFDSLLGTYYEFVADPTFEQTILTGFSQNAETFTTDAGDFYSVIPFDANSNVVYMRALTGSLTPYPYVSDASASRFYFDGVAAPNRKGIVVPKPPSSSNSPFGPPSGISYTLSAYEQSIPIGTQITHFLSQADIVQDSNAFRNWSGPGYSPTQIFADVSGVMMIQSTDFKFYSYPLNTTDRTFTYLFSLTIDDIYPASEATTLVAAAGTSTSYAFLGFQLVGAAYQIRIKLYNVGAGTLVDLSVPATYQIPDLGFSVLSFSISDLLGFVISGRSGAGVATTYRATTLASPMYTDTYPGYETVKTVQPPNSDTIYALPYLTLGGVSGSTYFTQNAGLASASRNTINIQVDTTTPSQYTNLAVTRIPGSGDEVLLFSTQDLAPALLFGSSRFYKVKQLTNTGGLTFSAKVEYSDFLFRTAPPALNLTVPLNVVGGALGSKWAFFSQQSYIQGNRNDQEDAPVLVQNAWQIFYPTAKIVLRKLANQVNPITDLSGLQYPEYPHTQMFVYNTKAAFSADISANKWGYETSGGLLPTTPYNLNSNGYLVSDVNFSGYYFNSYIFNVPLLPNSNTPEPYYYLTVRNYTPSEKSQVLLRFNMPQRYDFGFVRIRDLSNEPVFATSNVSLFNPTYFTALSNFNSQFVMSNRNFGYNPTQNIAGSNITASGFGDFIRQYTNLFNIYQSNVQVLNTITSNVNSNMFQFINDYLFYVLPDYARTRENFTSALTFSILWRSALTPLYLKAEDDWGLGYNLGYAKEDTPYATIQRAPSFYKILDDYIYLKLNVQYDMNRMDFGGKENLKETTDSTGQINGYNGKLLLNTFGSYAQTIIQNPVYFNPPVLKLDKLTFQWFDTAGTLITNTECDWNAAIQLVEDIPTVNIKGKNPVIIPR